MTTPVESARRDERARRWRQPTLWLRLGALGLFVLVPLVSRPSRRRTSPSRSRIFGALVASYDVVIGYTGIVSFGHAMFFGFGAYAVALSVGRFGAPTYGHLLLGFRHRRPALGGWSPR